MTQWYTKSEEEPPEEFGKRPEEREPEQLLRKGIVIVDKPFGPTSNQVSGWIREELDLKKSGHFGTLDPNATGILPVGLEKGTRVQKALSKAAKEYIFEVELEKKISKEELKETLRTFEGTNKQTPPEKSAVKKEEREREVYEIELIEAEEKRFLSRVRCESGFYVRVLVDQIEEQLDTDAEMNELRRTRQGDLGEEDCRKLQDVVDAYHFHNEGDSENLEEILQPIEKAVSHLKKVVVKNSAVNAVANGADLGSTGISKLQADIKEGELIAIMTLKGELIALAESEMTSQEMYDEEGTAATLESVHLDPEEYPRRWKQG